MSGTQGPQSTLTQGASSFLERLLTVTFYIQNSPGAPGTGTYTEATFAGLRISASVQEMGQGLPNTLTAMIYGLPLAFMNTASNLGTNEARFAPNAIRLTAGDAVNGFSQVYFGYMQACFVDASGAPDIALSVVSVSTLSFQYQKIPPTSFKGVVAVATVMQAIASQINFTFKNDGVSSTLSNPYFSGSVMDQLQACADAGNADLNVPLMQQEVVQITPIGQPNSNGPTPLISASTGMIGYPSYASTGLTVRCIFNPAIVWNGKIQIQSIFPQATGTWKVATITHTLESNTPDGAWETEIAAQVPWTYPQ